MRAHTLTMLVGLLVSLLASGARAQQEISVHAMLSDDRPYVGTEVRFTIVVDGSLQASIPDFPDVPGIRAGSPTTQRHSSFSFESVNGRMRQVEQIRLMINYDLVVDSIGEVTIPEIELTVRGVPFRTSPITLVAREPEASENAALLVEATRSVVYAGESVPVRFTFLFDAGTPRSLRGEVPNDVKLFEPRRPPWVELTQGQGISNMPFLEGATIAGFLQDVEHEGRRYDNALLIDRILVAERPGEVRLGPFTLTYTTESWAGRSPTERTEFARSKPLVLEVRALPKENRPATFNGLVGKASLRASAGARDVRVGDPIELTLTISADEPIERVQPPALDRQGGAWEAFQLDPAGWSEQETTPNSVTYRTTIRARSHGLTEIPAIELGFFEPETGRYDVARSEAMPLTVRETRVVSSAEVLGGRTIKDAEIAPLLDRSTGVLANATGAGLLVNESVRIDGVLRSPTGLIVLLLPPAIFGVSALVLAAGRRARSSEHRRRRALARALRTIRASPGRDAVARGVRVYVGERFAREPAAITPKDCMDLLAAEIGLERALEVADLLSEAERERFDASLAEPAPGDTLRASAREILMRADRSPILRDQPTIAQGMGGREGGLA